MSDESKLLYLLGVLIYLCLGLFRNILKERALFNQGKISSPNDSIEFFKYTSKNLTFGDVLFYPVQIFMITIIFIVLGMIRSFAFLLK
jgi:hypothetical protein